MTGPELLRLLMKERGLNPNALADALRDRRFQSQIQRFITGKTKSPRPETLEPIARFFNVGVEAFISPEIADRIAQDRGFIPRKQGLIQEPTPSYTPPVIPLPQSHQPSLKDSLRCIYTTLDSHDEQARRAVAALLPDLAMHPENGAITAERILAILGVMGKDSPRKSTASG